MNDGHTTECTYQKCAHPESKYPCPFVAVVNFDDPRINWVPACKHEWRQWYPNGLTNLSTAFFCVHCKKIEP